MEAIAEENEVENNEAEEPVYEQKEEESRPFIMDLNSSGKGSYRKLRFNARFVNGLAVGFGLGCIATFVILWIALFFTPQLSGAATYENLLSVFIYPLLYLLTVGLISVTAGLVKENIMDKNQQNQ